jgi:hypothetical protein
VGEFQLTVRAPSCRRPVREINPVEDQWASLKRHAIVGFYPDKPSRTTYRRSQQAEKRVAPTTYQCDVLH